MPAVEPTILCPECRAEIRLTESLAAPLVAATRKQYEDRIAAQSAEIAKREQGFREREEALSKAKADVEATIAEKLKAERDKLVADAAKRDQAHKDREAALAKERESLDAAIEERLKGERDKLAAETAKRDALLKVREAAIEKQKEAADTIIAEKLQAERTKLIAEEARKAKAAAADELAQNAKELAETKEILQKNNEKLAEAQKAQAELVRKQRELDDAKREMDLTIETRVSESLGKTREQAKKEAEAASSLKLIEKETQIASMQQKIEELLKKAEQGSQQLQGEALELQLESILSRKFPIDVFEPVPKGEHGGDILHRVVGPGGSRCGTILWEAKRHKNWSDGWLPKLRDDQRAAKAEIAIIASAVLPKGIDSFDQVDGVWIVHPKCVLPVAMSLRHMLVEVSTARTAGEGQQTKMEMIYHYLTGSKFRLRVQAIVEAFTDMSEDLAKEKKAILKLWAKRDEQINRVMESTVGMYGELQGIAGKSLGEIDGLRLLENQVSDEKASA